MERRQLRAQSACFACLLPVGGTLVALGESMLPGVWKEGALHRVWLKGKHSALLHFQAVLSFLSVLLCYFLEVHEEDWIFSYF